MSVEVKLPELGENVTSGDLLKVLVKPGDHIAKDQALIELETDKAAVEVPSPIEGVVRQVPVKEGQKVSVGQVIALVDEDGAGAKPQSPTPQVPTGGIATGAPPPVEQPLGKAQETKTPQTKPAASAPLAAPPKSQATPPKPEATPKAQAAPPSAPPTQPGKGEIVEVTLPELGENITEGDLLKVLVKPGDKVTEGQSLIEIETDKAAVEVPSTVAGTVREVPVKAGQKVKVGQVLAKIEQDAGAAQPSAAQPHNATPPPLSTGQPPPSPPTTSGTAETAPPASVATEPAPAPREILGVSPPSHTGISPSDVAAAPSVRALAREIGVDITEVRGTGEGGRITRDDVKEHARKKLTGAAGVGGAIVVPLPDFSRWGAVERKPMTAIRRKTAEHMMQAWTIPHVTNHDKADITTLDKLRRQYAAKAEEVGGKLTMTAIALKVVASAIRAFPQFAASIDLAKQEIVYKDYVHIGVAVDTERGLLVPVVRDADRKNIIELSVELAQLAQKARDRKLKLDEMEGSVFTITNLGGIGGTTFTPIINSPEVAILGMMRARMEPCYVNESFQPRLLLPLSLSYDHRLIDGADAARFLRWVCDAFEQPFLLSLQG